MSSNLAEVAKKTRTKYVKRNYGVKGGTAGYRVKLGVIRLGLQSSLCVLLVYLYRSNITIPNIPTERYSLTNQLYRNFTLERLPTFLGGENAADEKERSEEQKNKKRQSTKEGDVENESEVQIPKHEWPVTIRDEDAKSWDVLVHPGDHKSFMRVPQFWSKPIHQGKLMTRETAMLIGSCIEADPVTGNFNRGNSCPFDKRTIYVGIASYRDFQCRQTIESIYSRAAHPDRIRVGVVDQIVNGTDPICNAPAKPCDTNPEQALCKYAAQVDVFEMKARLSIGPVFARHIGYRLYRGEYYATQSDAHVTYSRNWDTEIISQINATGNEMAVLSTYLSDIEDSIDEHGRSTRDTRPIMCNTVFESDPRGIFLRHDTQPERVPRIHGMPQLQPWWAAGYSFSRGHFVVNVPYDWLQPMIFQGEEMSIGIRGFTVGYDYYAPERSVCFHHYGDGKDAAIRDKVPHFWENGHIYASASKGAMKRLLGIVHMNPEDPPESWNHTDDNIYGIGGVRTCEKFYKTFGISVLNKTMEKNLCYFVAIGKMHSIFQPKLRTDGMGIDYSTIDYEFTDPMSHAWTAIMTTISDLWER